MPLLHHAVIRVAETGCEVVVVLAPDAPVPSFPPGIALRVARDARRGEGPLAGLEAGLAAVSTDLALVVAGDMPDLSVPVLDEMRRVADEAPVDAVALADGHRVRPLPCVLAVREARARARSILRSDERSQRSLRSLLDTLRVAVIDEVTWRQLDPTGGTFHDIDEPGDLPGAAR